MNIADLNQIIRNKMSQADQLCLSIRSGRATADAEDKLELLSDEIEQLSDKLHSLMTADRRSQKARKAADDNSCYDVR